MKFLIIVTIVATVALVGAQGGPRDMFGPYIQSCASETGCTGDEQTKAIRHEKGQSKECQCFGACLKEKTGFMVNGKITLAKLQEMPNHGNPDMKARFISDAEACLSSANAESDKCLASSKFDDCMHDKRSAAGK